MPNFFHQWRIFQSVTTRGISVIQMIVLLAALCHTITGNIARENYEADYYSNVSLPCNFTLHNLTYPGIAVPFLRYWILPNASVVRINKSPFERVRVVSTNQWTFNLFIENIRDEDYGVYHCFMIWNNIDYISSSIRIGLNEDGPYYKDKLEQFERNVLIGCIAAGGVVLVVIIGCIACRCRRKKMESRREMSDLDYYSTPSTGGHSRAQGRHKIYENPILTTETSGEPAKPHRQESVEETYAQVNKKKQAPTATPPPTIITTADPVPDHTEHL